MACQSGWCSDGARVASPRTARAALSLTRGKRKRDERRLRLPSFVGVPGPRPEQEPTSGASALSLRAESVASGVIGGATALWP